MISRSYFSFWMVLVAAALVALDHHLQARVQAQAQAHPLVHTSTTNRESNINASRKRELGTMPYSTSSSSTSTSTSTSTSFADTFPDRNLVLDLMQLSIDIFDVDEEGISSASDAISDSKFELELWIEAEFSTEVMIVTSQDGENDGEELLPPIVVFRGSEERDDWMVNTNIVLVKSQFQNAPETVKVHRGFQSALFDQDVLGRVEETILDLVGGDSGEVILTGHSLGGANAHITAVYLADKYPNMKVTMINFGAPRIGNKDFKSWTEETLTNLSSWRFVYRADNIPRIIPDQLGYRHAGHLFMIYRYESEVYYHQRGGGEYEGAPTGWYVATSLRHHKARTYVEAFRDNINNNNFWPDDFERVSIKDCPWWNLFLLVCKKCMRK